MCILKIFKCKHKFYLLVCNYKNIIKVNKLFCYIEVVGERLVTEDIS